MAHCLGNASSGPLDSRPTCTLDEADTFVARKCRFGTSGVQESPKTA
jgi:hypothetical protein